MPRGQRGRRIRHGREPHRLGGASPTQREADCRGGRADALSRSREILAGASRQNRSPKALVGGFRLGLALGARSARSAAAHRAPDRPILRLARRALPCGLHAAPDRRRCSYRSTGSLGHLPRRRLRRPCYPRRRLVPRRPCHPRRVLLPRPGPESGSGSAPAPPPLRRPRPPPTRAVVLALRSPPPRRSLGGSSIWIPACGPTSSARPRRVDEASGQIPAGDPWRCRGCAPRTARLPSCDRISVSAPPVPELGMLNETLAEGDPE
jgi:hypothetical protein